MFTAAPPPPTTVVADPPYAAWAPVSSDPAVAIFAGVVVFLLVIIAVQSLRRG